MNYLEWNSAIIKHFFNPDNEEKEVMLYFSESIIDEIGVNNFKKPDCGYREDFYNALRSGVAGISNDNYIQRILRLEQKHYEGNKNINGLELDYPPYLTYLLAFILPFTSGETIDDFTMGMFHGYVKIFFEQKGLTGNYDGIIKNHLSEIDELWQRINEWLIIENDSSLGYLEEIIPTSIRKYVGKFEYHILFRKEQEERLSVIFDEKDILPGGAISEAEMRKLLVNNYQKLKLSSNTKNKINDSSDYIGQKIIKRALSFYKSWDGMTHMVEGKRGYSRNRLALCMDFDTLTQRISLKYFRIFSKNGIPENLELHNFFTGEVINDIHQINPFYSNPIQNCFKGLAVDVQLVDNAARSKYTWKTKDFYIFKKISQFDWVEIPKVEHNVGKTVVICKHAFYREKIEEWFNQIVASKKLYNDINKTKLADTWLAFTIDNITNFPHDSLLEFIPNPEEKPKINFDKSFYIDGKLFKDKLPNVWIENTEINENIFAKYLDGQEIQLIRESIIESGEKIFLNKYVFTEDHIKANRIDQNFKLVSGDITSHRFLQISEFNKKTNDFIESILPKRDEIGQITYREENYVKGVEHFFSDTKILFLMPYQKQLDTLFINEKDNLNYYKNSEYNQQHLGNILIHYISTKGQLSKKEFEDCIFTLSDKTESNDTDIKKTATQLRYLLQDLGYIDYNPEKSSFSINKPHIVIIPSAQGTTLKFLGARDSNLMKEISDYCRSHTNFTINIKTDSTHKLLPQDIFLNLKQCRHDLLQPLIQRFKIIFKKKHLFTQFALISFFSDISHWKNYINETPEKEIQDIEGGFLFDIEKLKFIKKPDTFKKDLSFIKFTNIDGYRIVYRLWYNNICHNIPDQQLGIYLNLYLYNKMKDENYKQCEKEKGSQNCITQFEAKDHALKITNIVVYDGENLLAVPLHCRLPRYFSNSLQLLSGQIPLIRYLDIEEVSYKGMYHIYQNIPKLFVSNTLNIKLLKRDFKSPILIKEIKI